MSDSLDGDDETTEQETTAALTVQELLQEHACPLDDEPLVLTSWVLVSEWMDADGARWLDRLWSPTSTRWLREGMLHAALYGDDQPDPEGDDA